MYMFLSQVAASHYTGIHLSIQRYQKRQCMQTCDSRSPTSGVLFPSTVTAGFLGVCQMTRFLTTKNMNITVPHKSLSSTNWLWKTSMLAFARPYIFVEVKNSDVLEVAFATPVSDHPQLPVADNGDQSPTASGKIHQQAVRPKPHCPFQEVCRGDNGLSFRVQHVECSCIGTTHRKKLHCWGRQWAATHGG